MATQKGGYFLKDGTKVPSVTTILSRFKESGGLIHWAWKLGTEGKSYRDQRDKAADAGTLAHDAVEAHIRNKPFEFVGPEDVVARAKNAFANFKEWASQAQLEVTHTEVPLVSEKYRFGGTLDGVVIKARRSIADWKTSNALYADYLMQVAAYRLLWNENFPDMPAEDECHIVRFSKDYGDFEHRYFQSIGDAEQAFLALAAAYPLVDALKARVR